MGGKLSGIRMKLRSLPNGQCRNCRCPCLESKKCACLTLLASDVPKTMVFVGCLTQLTLFLENNMFCFSQERMSAVSDITQKPLSWARLTQAVSDMHIFLLSTQEHLQFFVCLFELLVSKCLVMLLCVVHTATNLTSPSSHEAASPIPKYKIDSGPS